ncbi:MAG TPA: FHA domain-containing protein [Polyangia bacterium]|jgi:pSer/pThr/pTyr-binding forkhead associated (FHA) protein|nr:FHA domain-containing protein [Polyangia bacterium]
MPLRFRILAVAADAPDPGPAVERQVDVPDGAAEIRLGRRDDLEIVLPFAALSGLHARLLRTTIGFVLEDLGSRNGTAVEDRVLTAHGRTPLQPGQRFRLANIWLVFEGPVPAGAGAVEGTGTLARRLVSDLFAHRPGGGEVARLIVTSGPDAGRALHLDRADHPYSVGRDPEGDLVLTTGELSRAHASLLRRWEGVFVRDLASKNGVTVGDEPVEGERRLHDGDRLRMGAVEFSFEDPEDRYLRQMDAPLPAPRPSLLAGVSGVNLSHPDLSRVPMPMEIAPSGGAMADAHRPLSHRARLILAIAGMVVFTAIGLLVLLAFLP